MQTVLGMVRARLGLRAAVIRDTEKIEGNTGAGRFRHLRVAVRRDGR